MAVYWVGQDNNIWYKGDDGQVTNRGASNDLYGGGQLLPTGVSGHKSGSFEAQRIDDPNAGFNTQTTSGKATANDLAQFDQGIGMLNSSLGRLPGQLQIAEANIQDQYGVGANELQSARNQAQNTYRSQGIQNTQNYRTDKNMIADQGSQGLRGLLRVLGSMGAGGSSDARYVAPQAVAQQMTMQRSGAGQNFATNQRAIDTSWGNFQAQDENERRKLDDWRTQQLNQARSQSASTKQDLLSRLADLSGQRAKAAGGNVAASAQPYIDQANSLNSQIDNLARFSPTYQGNTPVYQQASLGSYDTAGNAAQVGADNALQSTTSPYLAMLLGLSDDRRRQQQLA